MLNELAEYSIKNKLITRPGFKSKNIKWIIALTEQGDFIGIEKTDRDFSMCPVLEQRELVSGSEVRSHFLVDSCEIVLCMIEKDKQDKKTQKIRSKHNYFINLLKSAGKNEPLLNICSNCLEKIEVLGKIQAHFKINKVKPTDNVTFKVGSIYPVDLDTWHDWWQCFRDSINSKQDEQEEVMVSLLDGSVIIPQLSHTKITGLSIVGGQPSGTSLVSFDKDAFKSFGLKQSQNAACSEEAVALYRAALDDLIKNAPRPLAGALYLHWYKEAIPAECDLLQDWDASDDEISIRNALDNANKLIQNARGYSTQLLHNRYYTCIIGAGGRIMVRDWMQGDYYELVNNIQKWVDDFP